MKNMEQTTVEVTTTQRNTVVHPILIQVLGCTLAPFVYVRGKADRRGVAAN